jgi:hypothetical protein
MPNLYIAPAEIKDNLPDFVQAATTKYDDALLRLSGQASRWIDLHCRRRFFPRVKTLYFDGNGRRVRWIDDVLSISALEYSEDYGATYTALAASGNWWLARAHEISHPGSYDQIVIDPNGTTIGVWPRYLRGLKLTGIWAYADDREECWESSGDTVQNNPLAAGGTSLTVTAVAGTTALGTSPRFGAGTLLRIGTEYIEVTAVATSTTLTILRGRNGSTAAEHAQGVAIDIWRPPDPVRQAAQILVVRSLLRAQQGYADSRADADLGQLFFLKKIDPEALVMLESYRLRQVA